MKQKICNKFHNKQETLKKNKNWTLNFLKPRFFSAIFQPCALLIYRQNTENSQILFTIRDALDS